MFTERKLNYVLFAMIAALQIGTLYYSLRPVDTLPLFSQGLSDKTWHFLTYYLLHMLTLYTLKSQYFLRSMIYYFCFGVGIEIAQTFFGRNFEYADIAANTAGIIFAHAIAHMKLKTFSRG